MYECRVTKYDPAFRDSRGVYTRDEWHLFGQIGQSFGGVVLTAEEYKRVEDAYATAVLAFLRESGISSLIVVGLENHGRALPFADGSILGLDDVGEAARAVLREEFWCRLESGAAFVHFGYDYYMYVGVPHPCPTARALAGQLGLFVEECSSPYSEQGST